MTSDQHDIPQNLGALTEQSAEGALVTLCSRKGYTLATAESCTGGLIAHRITNVPGASSVFLGGVVAYANAIKTTLLDVPEATLAAGGAVAEAVAIAMARGARARFGADYAMAVTGIAGPGGGTPEKPVGTVCFAWSGSDGTRVETQHFSGNRERIREQSVAFALGGLIALLLDSPEPGKCHAGSDITD